MSILAALALCLGAARAASSAPSPSLPLPTTPLVAERWQSFANWAVIWDPGQRQPILEATAPDGSRNVRMPGVNVAEHSQRLSGFASIQVEALLQAGPSRELKEDSYWCAVVLMLRGSFDWQGRHSTESGDFYLSNGQAKHVDPSREGHNNVVLINEPNSSAPLWTLDSFGTDSKARRWHRVELTWHANGDGSGVWEAASWKWKDGDWRFQERARYDGKPWFMPGPIALRLYSLNDLPSGTPNLVDCAYGRLTVWGSPG